VVIKIKGKGEKENSDIYNPCLSFPLVSSSSSGKCSVKNWKGNIKSTRLMRVDDRRRWGPPLSIVMRGSGIGKDIGFKIDIGIPAEQQAAPVFFYILSWSHAQDGNM